MKQQIEASLDPVREPDDLWSRALEIQKALTEKGQHRAASVPGLVVAATAQAAGLIVLHYDNDFETIASFTEQATRWVVPAGTV